MARFGVGLRGRDPGWAGCRFDGGHTYRFRFTRAMFSRLDYFHPSLLGQATLAAETWRMSWWGA
jgi:hypothetical protein